MKIVADINIPLLDLFSPPGGELVVMPGREICAHDVHDADVLLVRSVTRVNEALLKGSSVKFVGSATGGADHLDTDYLTQQGIVWTAAPGCNAPSVADYVLSCIASLQIRGLLPRQALRVGVVGVGHIGALVVAYLDKLGFDVIQHDPLRAANESDFVSTPLSHFADRDLVCVHTPLTFEGPYKTHHLIDGAFMLQQKSGSVIMNAARGAVVDFSAVKTVGGALTWCLDVWEDEPTIDCEVLQQAVIATPHVAGYAIESKYRGTRQVYAAACEALGWPKRSVESTARKSFALFLGQVNWQERVLSVYDPALDTQGMKETLVAPGVDVAKAFDRLRASYPVRHEL